MVTVIRKNRGFYNMPYMICTWETLDNRYITKHYSLIQYTHFIQTSWIFWASTKEKKKKYYFYFWNT